MQTSSRSPIRRTIEAPLGTDALAVKPGPRTGESVPAGRGKAGTRLWSTGWGPYLCRMDIPRLGSERYPSWNASARQE